MNDEAEHVRQVREYHERRRRRWFGYGSRLHRWRIRRRMQAADAKRKRGLTGATLLLVVMGGAPAAADPWTGTLPRVVDAPATFAAADVWVFGDSITAADFPDLRARLAGARNLRSAVDAQPGIPTTPGVDRLEEHLEDTPPPRILVMALGTNDTDDPSTMPAQMQRVAELVPTSTTVVWVNVWKCRWRLDPATQLRDRAGTAAVNAAIVEFATAHRNFRLADWWTTVERTDPRRYLGDGVHTLSDGRAARDAVIAWTVTRPKPSPRLTGGWSLAPRR